MAASAVQQLRYMYELIHRVVHRSVELLKAQKRWWCHAGLSCSSSRPHHGTTA